MSQLTTTIPKKLPTIEKGLELFRQWRDSPCKMLGGLCPIDLFKGPWIDADRVWVVGSAAWVPFVSGKKFKLDHGRLGAGSDIDLFFRDRDQAMSFADGVMATLREKQPEHHFYIPDEPNRFGGPKIKAAYRDEELLDVAWLPPSGATIAEVIIGFRHHERVSVVLTANSHDLSAVIRLVRPWEHRASDEAHRAECHACNEEYTKPKYYDFS